MAASFADGSRWTADGSGKTPPADRVAARERRPHTRLLTHALVLGAVIAPMSFTVASAQTSPLPAQRVTIPLELDDSLQAADTAGALRAAAAEVVIAPAPPAPVAAAPTPAPAPKAPARRVLRVASGNYSQSRFAYGYCTWYVAGKRNIPWLGNAIEWWPNAASFGFAEGQVPKVGAIMVTRESGWGHVAYVESVDGNGGFTVSEMNYVGFAVVSTRHFSSNPSVLVGFIY